MLSDFDHPMLPSFFIRDHLVIVSKHPDRFPGVTLDRIFHIDDTPRSVLSLDPVQLPGEKLKRSAQQVKMFPIDRKDYDKKRVCQNILNDVRTFLPVHHELDK